MTEELQKTGSQGIDRAAKFKLAGLIGFIAIIAVIVVLAWPYIADVFSEGGLERLVERVKNAGPAGVLILLGMQFLQVVVAFIPGEVVQLAAGLMYGPWLGALIILVGCVISSALIYRLVHELGAPFVASMVSTKHMDRFKSFEESKKLEFFVFILFLIPGLPKDVFTYLVPLTSIKMKRFLLLTTVGRIPGVVASTYAASEFVEGNYAGSVGVLAVVAAIAVVAIILFERFSRNPDRGEADGQPESG